VRVQGLVFAGVETPDPAALAAFLGGVLEVDAAEDDGVWTLSLPDGSALALIQPGHLAPPSDTILGFLVDDVEAATAELAAKGIEKDGPLFAGARFRWQHFRAPDGRFFELLDRRV
jgi:hypothetical protein